MQKPTITLEKSAKRGQAARGTLSLKPGVRRKPRATAKRAPAPEVCVQASRAEKLSAARKHLATSPTWSGCLPMAIGIHKQILASRPEGVPHKLIRQLIARRINHKNYLAKIVTGASRFNWTGAPDGEVTEAEAEYTRKRMQEKTPTVTGPVALTKETARLERKLERLRKVTA
jgi:ProP effector